MLSSAAASCEPFVFGSILYGKDEEIGEMVRARIPHLRNFAWGPFWGLGIVRCNALVGGVVFNNFKGFDVHLSAAFWGKGWALPQTIAALCDFPFGRLKVNRVTAITGKKNRKARAALEYLGFTLEGVSKRGLDGFEDAMTFGLLKENCKWINANGITTSTRAA